MRMLLLCAVLGAVTAGAWSLAVAGPIAVTEDGSFDSGAVGSGVPAASDGGLVTCDVQDLLSGLLAQGAARTDTVALASATGTFITHGGPSGEPVAPGKMLPGATVMYGRLGNGKLNKLYRLTDGVTWTPVYTDAGVVAQLWTMPDDTVLFLSNANGDVRMRRGLWNGQSLLVSPMSVRPTVGNVFSSILSRDQLFVTDTGATIFMEYSDYAKALGLRIWRSPDYGAADFSIVYTNTDDGGKGHFHGGGFHAATRRCVVSRGDATSVAQLVSDDDGLTWSYLPGFETGNLAWRPVGFLDVGDATRLLVGDDGPGQVCWFRPSDGWVEPLMTTLPRTAGNSFVWSLHYEDGIYYACHVNHIGAPTGTPNAGIWVSRDLTHWSLAYALPPKCNGSNYAGTAGGKLHFAVDTGDGSWCDVTLQNVVCNDVAGVRLEPAATNLLTAAQANMETGIAGWYGADGTTLQNRTTSSVAGSRCLVLTGPSYGMRAAYCGKSGLTGNVIGCLHVRCVGNVPTQFNVPAIIYAGGTYTRSVYHYCQAGPDWQLVWTPVLNLHDGENLVYLWPNVTLSDWGTNQIEIDAAGLFPWPVGSWVDGGQTRPADVLNTTFHGATTWTLVAAVAPEHASHTFEAWTGPKDTGAVPTGTYEMFRVADAADAATYARVCYDSGSRTIKLQHVVDGVDEGLSIETPPLHWHREGPVYIAVRRSATELTLSVQTSADIIHVSNLTRDDTTLRDRDLSVAYVGTGCMPLTIGDLRAFPVSLNDAATAEAFNMGVPAGQDCNGNGTPDECDIASGTSQDCNGNGIPDECDIANGTSQDLNGDGIPDECQLDVRVVPVATLVDPATTDDVCAALPSSINGVVRGSHYYVEIWASDVGLVNTGLTGAYLDVSFEAATSAVALRHGGTFTTSVSGTIQPGWVDEFGGVSLSGGGGTQPEWVRLGWLEMSADVDVPACRIALQPGGIGIAALGRGMISWDLVQLDSIALQILPPSQSYDPDIAFKVALVPSPSTSDYAAAVPASSGSLGLGGVCYAEIWASDVGRTNTGLASACVDVRVESENVAVTGICHGGLFTLSASGTIGAAGIDEFGGSALLAGVGVEPQWVRLGYVALTTGLAPCSVTVSLQPSSAGVRAQTRGLISPADILLDTTTALSPMPGDINRDRHVDVVDLLYLIDAFGCSAGDPGYDARCDLDGDSSVDVIDLLVLVSSFGM